MRHLGNRTFIKWVNEGGFCWAQVDGQVAMRWEARGVVEKFGFDLVASEGDVQKVLLNGVINRLLKFLF